MVDGVRVRPLHEEMTASLLEQVEKRRAQKTSRASATREQPSGFAATVIEAADSAGNPPTPERSGSDGKAMVAATGPAPAGAGCPVPLGAGESVGASMADGTPSEREEKEAGGDSATDPTPPVAGSAETAQARAESARRTAEAERRRAALATIKNHRSQPNTASAAVPGAGAAASPAPAAALAAAVEVVGDGAGTRSPGAAEAGTSQLSAGASPAATVPTAGAAPGRSNRAAAVAGKVSFRVSPAFSRQSVRSGVTLGYYGREEMDVLSAISKNPSRIAAYTRITEGKRGSDDDGAGPEVSLRGTPAKRASPISIQCSVVSNGGEQADVAARAYRAGEARISSEQSSGQLKPRAETLSYSSPGCANNFPDSPRPFSNHAISRAEKHLARRSPGPVSPPPASADNGGDNASLRVGAGPPRRATGGQTSVGSLSETGPSLRRRNSLDRLVSALLGCGEGRCEAEALGHRRRCRRLLRPFRFG